MLFEGKTYGTIAKAISANCNWADVQAFCWESDTLSYQGAKSLISRRLNKLVGAGQRQQREEFVRDIRKKIDYIYYCGRATQRQLEKIRKAME